MVSYHYAILALLIVSFKKMKKFLPIIAIIVLLWLRVMGKYNGLVVADESVNGARAQVENQYQRRADLVPNLVATVKGIADQEERVFTAVTEARAKASSTNVDINDPASLEAFQSAQWELQWALSRLLVTVENYPDLKSNQNFLELQAQLEGTENRISTERKRFNDVARNFNIMVRTFPTNIVATIFNFANKSLFQAEEWAEQAPDVDFWFDNG